MPSDRRQTRERRCMRTRDCLSPQQLSTTVPLVQAVGEYAVRYGRWMIFSLIFWSAISPALAQNSIAQDGWEGFVVRNAVGKFDYCVLYNRKIEALNVSPYDMFGLSGHMQGIGLFVFYQPRTFQRGDRPTVQLKVDKHATLTLAGNALSDFHVAVAGPLDANVVRALRQSKTIEATTEGKSIEFAVSGVDLVLDRLDACVKSNTR